MVSYSQLERGSMDPAGWQLISGLGFMIDSLIANAMERLSKGKSYLLLQPHSR